MNTEPIPPETILEKRARLEAIVEECHAQMSAMNEAVELETVKNGLSLCGAKGAWLDAKTCHEQCVAGELTASDKENDGYDLQKHFWPDGSYHEALYVEVVGLGRIGVTANDGTLAMSVIYENNSPAFFAINFHKAKQWLADLGITIKAGPLKFELGVAEKRVAKLTSAISLIES